MRFPTMWYVRPANSQISLRIRTVWSEPLLVAWVFYDCWATDWAPFGVSKLKRRLQRLVRTYTCQKATLLEISCTGSYLSAICLYFSKKIKWSYSWLYLASKIAYFTCYFLVLPKVGKGAKIRNRYNEVPHLTQDTNGKVTDSQLDTTHEKYLC